MIKILLYCEAGTLFEILYRKAPPLQPVSVEMTGFPENVRLWFFFENAKSRYKRIYPNSHLRHRFLIKLASFPARKVPQIGLMTYKPKFDRACSHYKKAHIHLQSFENSPQNKYTELWGRWPIYSKSSLGWCTCDKGGAAPRRSPDCPYLWPVWSEAKEIIWPFSLSNMFWDYPYFHTYSNSICQSTFSVHPRQVCFL